MTGIAMAASCGVTPGAQIIVDTNVPSGVGSASAILNTLGVVAGDIAIVLDNGGAPNSDGAGSWTAISNASPTLGSFYWKVLNSTDVAGKIRPGATNVTWSLIVARGASSLSPVRTASASGVSSASATGITRSANYAGLIGMVTQTGSSGETLTGFTGGVEVAISSYGSKVLYLTTPPSAAYVDGTSFSYGTSGTANIYLVVAELLI